MFNFSGGEWIVEALKLFEQSPVLRRMFYAVVLLIFFVGTGAVIAKALPGIAEIIKVLNG